MWSAPRQQVWRRSHFRRLPVDRIEQFFQTFTTRAGESFAESFLVADAAGARPVTRADFLRFLPRRAEMFAAQGIGRAELVSLATERLDEHYALVRTEWSAPRLDGG